ncbi:LANO_0G02454g1_1 [Lachancea nothofagi CBS 11611]|uniref:Protein YIF1 n=1 Tax=Lachancea nothofagi CBS 11611 TaxID=1266666 RepID=A0A1G4KF98_9SACH|nr:LANO_0G02454g1_1 [Lachancea nothofagi CBS 11611]
MSYNPYAYAAENGGNMNLNERSQPAPQATHHQPSFGSHVPNQPAPNAQSNGFPFQGPSSSMAYQLGQSAFSNFIGQDNFNQFQENLTKATGDSSAVSHYFQVSNSYVFRKLKIILLPFLHRSWQRLPNPQNGTNGGPSFQVPRVDVNSPDMYIPVMGLVTYILCWNFQQGLRGSFDPGNLYQRLSTTLASVLMDLFILKMGLFLLVSAKSPTTSIIELACYVGYKFIPLTLALILPSTPYFVSVVGKVYLLIAFGVFLLRSVKFNLFLDSGNDVHTVKKSVVKKCNYFLFMYGFVWQSVLMWLMG